ncbi:unnamed protein product [Brucella canis str. Oliveri]|nr:unnamed protein product [Brucella canis str. Oliveri]
MRAIKKRWRLFIMPMQHLCIALIQSVFYASPWFKWQILSFTVTANKGWIGSLRG